MENNTKVYGKIEGGQVVEFPVTAEVIVARGHRLHQYSPVVYGEKPTYDPRYQKLSGSLVIEGGVIKVSYTVASMTTEELLASLKNADGTVKTIGELSPQIVALIRTSVANYVESRIEMLCKSHGYTSMDRLLGSYSNSTESQYKNDAAFIQGILDKAWKNLTAYYQALAEGTQPLPTSVEDILRISEVPASW